MQLPTYWLAVVMAAASLASLALGWRAARMPDFPGRRSFTGLLLAAAWWSGAAAVEQFTGRPEAKVFWAEMAWPGIVATPGFWVLFLWNYIHGQHRPLPRAIHAVLAGFAVAVWALALTNDAHHLLYRRAEPVGAPPYMTVNYFHGPLFFVVAVIVYALMILCEALLVFEIVRTRHVYRAQFLGFAAASLLPWLFNVGYTTMTVTAGTADLTSVGFVAMDAIFLWLIGRRHLFDLLPIAHGTLLDAIPDPVLVLDTKGRIADCNPAARALAPSLELKGLDLGEVPELRASLAAIEESMVGPREAAIGDPPRHFDVEQVILTYAEREVGRLILLREITHRKEAEFRLQAALDDLERQLASNLELQQRLREQAIRDSLTGLHNRRFFEELAPSVFAEAQRSGSPLAAAAIDIDHFKRLNDTHGHDAGDAVLRAIGAFLRRSVRQSDMVFRMGGEEFLVLLPHTQEDRALRRIEDWRAEFAGLAIEHDGKTLSATFSAGLAVYPTDAGNIHDLLRRADQALYRAKTEGRNRTARWREAA